jgi:PAS domain S-box-containing protein
MIEKAEKGLSASRRADAQRPDNPLPSQLLQEMNALRESEKRFKAAFEKAPVSIARVDLGGRFLEVNQRMCDMVGYTREELLTKTFADITQPDYLEADWRELRRMMAGELDFYYREKRYCRKDGAFVWANLTVSLARKADGSPDYFVAVIVDVSARKQAEENLRQSERRFKATFENAAVGIARLSPDGRWLEVNQRLCDIVGYAREELMTKTFGDITHPDDLDADWSQARRLLSGDIASYSMEKRYHRKDGAAVWVNLTVSVVRMADGSPDYFVSVVEDISARRRAEDMLREREERLRLATTAANLGVFEWDLQAGRAIWENERMYEIFGHTRADGALDRAELLEMYVSPEDVPSFEQALAGGIKSGRPFHTVYRIRRKDGATRWLDLAAVFELAADGAPVRMLGVLGDITERKRLEEASLKRVALLADVNAALAEHQGSLREMLQKCAEAMVRHLGAAFARIWTLNQKESLLELQASAGLYTHLNGKHSRVPVGKLKIGLIAEARQPHLTNDVKNDPLISDPAWARELNMTAFAGYPLKVEDRVVGVMAMFARRPLAEETIEALTTVAAPVAQGIERKRAEEALGASEGRLRTMLSAIPSLTYEFDPAGHITFVSDQWLAYTGMTADEGAGMGVADAVHPDEADAVKALWLAAQRSGAPFESQHRILAADGSYRWFLSRALPGRDEDGRIVRWAFSLTDIDDLIRIGRALRESKERLSGIVSSAMDAIITVDEDLRVVLFNEAAEKMFGCPAAEALGSPIGRFIPSRLRGAYAEHVRRFGENGGAGRAAGSLSALTARRADGTEFPIEAAISSVEVGGRKLYTVIHRDITERKLAEAEREQLAQEQAAREAAEAANRSKDEFLAMVSHELRSPLNAILGYTRMLRSGSLDQDAIKKAADVVERSAKAQVQIIEDLLDSARIISGKLRIELETIDLIPAIETALEAVRPAAEAKGVSLRSALPRESGQITGDPARLQQVIWNLLSNAVKFTPQGGHVELRMKGAPDQVRITVSDTGSGIEPEFLPHVFDRFRQADSSSKRRVGGLGLGLSLVKHLVESHGGAITAGSEGPGRGATFTVTLPRRPPQLVAQPRPTTKSGAGRMENVIPTDQPISLAGVSVLMVNDQEEAREVLTKALGEYGARVTAVSSGVEALAFLSNPRNGKRPDALILDIAMPAEDGYALLKKIRALEVAQGVASDRIPAIALTTLGRSEDRVRALRAGFMMHVAKPVEPAELAVALASLTARRAQERKR